MRHKDSLTAQAMATAWRHHYPNGGQQHRGRPPQPSPETNETCDRCGPVSVRTEEAVMHSTSLLRVHRTRLCARVILLPLLAAVTVLATAVTAQGMPIKAAARGHSLALAASRPPAGRRHIGAVFSPGPWRSGPAPSAGPFTGSSGFGSALAGSAPAVTARRP